MPAIPAVSYPGVYIQEVPGGVHTIIGVSTSITAFIGRTLRGPVNEPVIVTSYADFERTFGGTWSQSQLPDAVRDFYMNGGNQAIIVRLYHSSGTEALPQIAPLPAVTVTEEQATSAQSPGKVSRQAVTAPAAPTPPVPAPVPAVTNALLSVGGLTLQARNPGTWANTLMASLGNPDVRDDNDAQSRYGLNKKDLFNLTITEPFSQTTEIFRNVTVQPDAQQRVDLVLLTGSKLIFASGSLPQSVTVPATGAVTTPAKDDGVALTQADFLGGEGETFDLDKKGLYALEKVDLFNLLCIPPYQNDDVETAVIGSAAAYCEKRRAILLLDPPTRWQDMQTASQEMSDPVKNLGTSSANALVFFPRVKRAGSWKTYAPSGAIAGIMARTDIQRGVWKAAAGLSATLAGVSEPSVPLTDLENGILNPLGLNCLRTMPGAGPVVWGARTLQGADILSSDWKYAPVRRLALYIEESLYRATRWAVFEPNDEPLWAQLRLSIGGFMQDLFRQGAFQGQTPKDAYFVQCDGTTTAQADIDRGIVNILVGFAPVKPAEFVVLYIQPSAGQAAL